MWIAFRGDDVFVDDATVLVESLDAIEPSPIRTLFIGTLGERPVFVAEAQGNEPDDRFVSLRSAMSVSRELFGIVSLAAQRLRFERTHVFCGRCGRETVDKPGDRAKTCASCELDVYPPVSPAIIVLVHDDRRLLLAHRPRPFFSLVAGFVESGESGCGSARRAFTELNSTNGAPPCLRACRATVQLPAAPARRRVGSRSWSGNYGAKTAHSQRPRRF